MSLHLPTSHLVVRETIKNRFASPKPTTVDVRVADFDDTQYRVLVEEDNKNLMKYSIALRDCKKYLAPDYAAPFESIYSKFMGSVAEAGHDLTLTVNLEELPETEEEKNELADLLSKLKRNIIACPLRAMGEALVKGSPLTESFGVEFRLGEFMFFVPAADRVAVVYALTFSDQTDNAIARVFLQEFNEVRRLPGLGSAPHPHFSPNVPGEITKDPKLSSMLTEDSRRAGYITFGFEARHFSDNKKEAVFDHVLQFRSFLDYHIKASKSQMHSRMRKRVESLLQVLNRAIPDIPRDKKEFKTITGTTFRVQGGGAAGL